MAQVEELLAAHVRRAADFDPGSQVCSACVLWSDGERRWEPAIPALQKDLPELLVLGVYDPKRKTGPAIWLRCAIGHQADDVMLPGDRTPILYLPGFSRQDLRAVESVPCQPSTTPPPLSRMEGGPSGVIPRRPLFAEN